MLTHLLFEYIICFFGSYIVGAVLHLFGNAQKISHEKFQIAAGKFVPEAKRERYPIVRGFLVLSVFLVYPMILLFAAFMGVGTDMPSDVHSSFLWGFIHESHTTLLHSDGYVYLIEPVTDIMASMGGLYFSHAHKR